MKLGGVFSGLVTLSNAIAVVYARPNVVLADAPAASTAETDEAVPTADVVIIGAGISAIGAIKTLVESNVTDFIIVDGRDTVGGRAYAEWLHNSKTGGDTLVEKGCNWIQGSGHANITRLAKKWGLKTAKQNYSDMVYFDGKWGISPKDTKKAPGHFVSKNDTSFMGLDRMFGKLTEFIDDRLQKNLVDMNLQAGFRMIGYLPKTALEKLYSWWSVDFEMAQSPEDCSLFNTFGDALYQDDPDNLVIDQRGYRYIFMKELEEALGKSPEEDERVHLSETVTKVDYSGDKIKLYTTNGTIHARKHVVSTVSVGVLQNDDLKWTPELPYWKREAINTFYMSVYQKIHLLFDRKFWRDEQFVGYADPDVRGRHPLWQNLNAPGFFNGSESGYIYFVTNVDNEARRLEAMSDEDIKAELMLKLREMYGKGIPDPLDMTVPRWTHDPLYRGSYSNWPVGSFDEQHYNLGQPIAHSKIFFTGEAMSDESFGYVQGAWEEGKKTGAQVVQCLQGACADPYIYEEVTSCSQTESELWKRGRGRQARRIHGRHLRRSGMVHAE